jgi:hypothetical protein
VAEANSLLETMIRAAAEEMVNRRREIRELEEARGELVGRAAGNGANIDPTRLGELDDRLRSERDALARCVLKIQAEGVQVKDVDVGLVDFPAKLGGEDVLLCWQVGEAEIAWFHSPEDGFAGRRPLDEAAD